MTKNQTCQLLCTDASHNYTAIIMKTKNNGYKLYLCGDLLTIFRVKSLVIIAVNLNKPLNKIVCSENESDWLCDIECFVLVLISQLPVINLKYCCSLVCLL